jgi:hypothetical protein
MIKRIQTRGAHLALGIALAAFSTAAHAQTATVHPASINLKGALQDEAPSGDDRIANVKANQKTIFGLYEGTPPTNTQGVFVVCNCEILICHVVTANTDPAQVLSTVTGPFEIDPIAVEEKNGATTRAVAQVDLDFEPGGDVLGGSFEAEIDVRFSELGSGQNCPNTATLKGNGTLLVDSEEVLIRDGSSIKASNRSGSIVLPAPVAD